ncbi:hypothetical protein IAR50_000088 [Cryptococcus sp. DSM 104548]
MSAQDDQPQCQLQQQREDTTSTVPPSTAAPSLNSYDGGAADETALEEDTYLDENNELRWFVHTEEPESITDD